MDMSVATLPRADKWLAQTPQMFRIGILLEALERAGDTVTDEASAIEALGLAPLLVAGERAELQAHLFGRFRAGRGGVEEPVGGGRA